MVHHHWHNVQVCASEKGEAHASPFFASQGAAEPVSRPPCGA
jgi:hypothetical protein